MNILKFSHIDVNIYGQSVGFNCISNGETFNMEIFEDDIKYNIIGKSVDDLQNMIYNEVNNLLDEDNYTVHSISKRICDKLTILELQVICDRSAINDVSYMISDYVNFNSKLTTFKFGDRKVTYSKDEMLEYSKNFRKESDLKMEKYVNELKRIEPLMEKYLCEEDALIVADRVENECDFEYFRKNTFDLLQNTEGRVYEDYEDGIQIANNTIGKLKEHKDEIISLSSQVKDIIQSIREDNIEDTTLNYLENMAKKSNNLEIQVEVYDNYIESVNEGKNLLKHWGTELLNKEQEMSIDLN